MKKKIVTLYLKKYKHFLLDILCLFYLINIVNIIFQQLK